MEFRHLRQRNFVDTHLQSSYDQGRHQAHKATETALFTAPSTSKLSLIIDDVDDFEDLQAIATGERLDEKTLRQIADELYHEVFDVSVPYIPSEKIHLLRLADHEDYLYGKTEENFRRGAVDVFSDWVRRAFMRLAQRRLSTTQQAGAPGSKPSSSLDG